MKTYQITIGGGLYYNFTVEDREYKQTAINKLIDKLEAEGSENLFISEDRLDEYEEEYVQGGRHGRYLYHGRNLNIELLRDNSGETSCTHCSGIDLIAGFYLYKDKNFYIEFDPENAEIDILCPQQDTECHIAINNCPFCGRKLRS